MQEMWKLYMYIVYVFNYLYITCGLQNFANLYNGLFRVVFL